MTKSIIKVLAILGIMVTMGSCSKNMVYSNYYLVNRTDNTLYVVCRNCLIDNTVPEMLKPYNAENDEKASTINCGWNENRNLFALGEDVYFFVKALHVVEGVPSDSVYVSVYTNPEATGEPVLKQALTDRDDENNLFHMRAPIMNVRGSIDRKWYAEIYQESGEFRIKTY